jgi:hypothetical protein
VEAFLACWTKTKIKEIKGKVRSSESKAWKG